MTIENQSVTAAAVDQETSIKTWATPVVEIYDVDDITLASNTANPDAGAGSS